MNILSTIYNTDSWDILILTSCWIENWQPNELNSPHKNGAAIEIRMSWASSLTWRRGGKKSPGKQLQ